ncbi:hypothetical protein HYT00_01700 [Candidatus Giovannonibacteria bacterium]|nr:hypothetical protein [Candidatus Giovannonibacteria bacterium]
MLTQFKRKVILWISIAAFIVLMPVVMLYALGYRLDDTWQLRKTGGINITSDITGSEIFLNGQLKKTTNLLQKDVFIDNLAPGKYEIQVLANGYLPWVKKLEVFSQLVTEVRPLLIPSDSNLEIILRGQFSELRASPYDSLVYLSEEKDNEKILRWFLPKTREFLSDTGPLLKYKKSFELVRWLPGGAVFNIDGKVRRVLFNLGKRTVSAVPIGDESPLKNGEELAQVFEKNDPRDAVQLKYSPSDKNMEATWIAETIRPHYFSSTTETLILNKTFRNFDFFPERRDAVIAAYDNGVWAIEIDSRGGRLIIPIYKGKNPDFILLPDSRNIYILDDRILIEVSPFAKNR